VNDGERRRSPAGKRARRVRRLAGPVGDDRMQHAITRRRERRDQRRPRRLVEILGALRRNAEADGADPVEHAGVLAQEGQDAGGIPRQFLGQVEEAETRRICVARTQLLGESPGDVAPALSRGVAGTKGGGTHGGPSARARATSFSASGNIPSTMRATPFGLG